MRRKYLLGFAVLLAGVILLLLLLPRPAARAGKFVPAPPGFKVPGYKRLGYSFLQLTPFQGGKMWVRTDRRWYLYNIETKQVEGELISDWPVLLNADQSKVLVVTDDPSLSEIFFKWMDKVTSGRFDFGGVVRSESFRLLDLKTSESVRMGRLYQAQGMGSTWVSSPTFRYGYNSPTVQTGGGAVYLCDLQEVRMKKISIAGDPAGWWDDTKILLKTPGNELSLYDVESKKTSPLVSANVLEGFLRNNEITNHVSEVFPFRDVVNGQPRFHLTDRGKRAQATNAFLAKIERPPGALSLITNDFKFEWSDHLDATGRYYLYSGRQIGKASSAVFVRDLVHGTTRTLLEDNGEKQFSLPRWYGDDVVYIRSNMLWRISLTNPIPTRLFPPSGN